MERKLLNQRRYRRSRRTRAGILGTAQKPRLSVFRSNKFIYAQLIDDENKRTLVNFSSRGLKKEEKKKKKSEQADLIGKMVAEKALVAGITNAVLDRGAYKYHGRVKALAEGAKKAGLKI